MHLTSSEIDLFDRFRLIAATSKTRMKLLQNVFVKYNPTEGYHCMCRSVERKIKHKQFYEWYDQIAN
jgi:hypothetical protein